MPGFVPLEDTLLAQATITGPDIKGILSRHHHIRWRNETPLTPPRLIRSDTPDVRYGGKL